MDVGSLTESRAMRHVLIIVQNLPVPLDRRVWMECLALVDAGYRVSVICPRGEGDPDFEVLERVHIHKYDPPPPSKGLKGFAWEFAYCLAQTVRLMRRVGRVAPIDAIQACNPPDTFFLLAAPLKLRGVRFIFDQHDLCPELYESRFERPRRIVHRLLTLLERATYRTADHVISTNDSFRQVALRRGRRRIQDVTVVRSGPKAAVMVRGEPEPELRMGRAHLCVYLGVMGPQDGVDVVIRLADELVHRRGRSDVHFALLGFGDCYESLRALTTKLGVEDHITFTGRADDTMIKRYLSTANVGLSPDPKNPMNDLSTMNKTLEYMAHELPVAAFDLHETRVSAGGAAVYAQPNEVSSFADAVEALLDDPVRREQMGRSGRKRLEESLSWENSAVDYVGVYNRMFGRATGRTVWSPAAVSAARQAASGAAAAEPGSSGRP
jgi:glycosyltransferase involved in cell wall biosynthesis